MMMVLEWSMTSGHTHGHVLWVSPSSSPSSVPHPHFNQHWIIIVNQNRQNDNQSIDHRKDECVVLWVQSVWQSSHNVIITQSSIIIITMPIPMAVPRVHSPLAAHLVDGNHGPSTGIGLCCSQLSCSHALIWSSSTRSSSTRSSSSLWWSSQSTSSFFPKSTVNSLGFDHLIMVWPWWSSSSWTWKLKM